jgi:hypothetical protein
MGDDWKWDWKSNIRKLLITPPTKSPSKFKDQRQKNQLYISKKLNFASKQEFQIEIRSIELKSNSDLN